MLPLWTKICGEAKPPNPTAWGLAEKRAQLDATVAQAYGLSLKQFAAVLCTFPNLDTVQPMLPGESKSFVTRDLALLAYCRSASQMPADVSVLLREIGVDLPQPHAEHRRLDVRVERYRELGAVPYRPTPRGGRRPTDPALIAEVQHLLTSDATGAEEMADGLCEDEKVVAAVLEELVRDGEAYAEGRGKRRRYYVISED